MDMSILHQQRVEMMNVYSGGEQQLFVARL